MGIQFDDGESVSGGGKTFVNWHAQPTKDGEIKAESFSMRDGDKNRVSTSLPYLS
jgi:hypothetical protein